MSLLERILKKPKVPKPDELQVLQLPEPVQELPSSRPAGSPPPLRTKSYYEFDPAAFMSKLNDRQKETREIAKIFHKRKEAIFRLPAYQTQSLDDFKEQLLLGTEAVGLIMPDILSAIELTWGFERFDKWKEFLSSNVDQSNHVLRRYQEFWNDRQNPALPRFNYTIRNDRRWLSRYAMHFNIVAYRPGEPDKNRKKLMIYGCHINLTQNWN